MSTDAFADRNGTFEIKVFEAGTGNVLGSVCLYGLAPFAGVDVEVTTGTDCLPASDNRNDRQVS